MTDISWSKLFIVLKKRKTYLDSSSLKTSPVVFDPIQDTFTIFIIQRSEPFLYLVACVPSFNSTALSTFFSFTTLTPFSFSYWTTIKSIFRNVILGKTVEKRNNLTQAINRWKVHSKMSAKWSLLCFRSRAWSRGSFRTCHWLAKWIRWLADCSVKRSAQLYSDFSDRFSASRRWIPWWYK